MSITSPASFWQQWFSSERRQDWIAVVTLLVVGGFLRLWDLAQIPCGLFPDQANHGLDAVLLSQGLVLPVYGGDEGLFVYLVAIVQFFFGTGIWQVILTSALVGTATLASTYLAVKVVFNRKLAFLTAFILAVSSWHIALSRDGFRAILVPLIVTLFIFVLTKALQAKSAQQQFLLYPLAAGLFALGFYTYYAYVIFALLIGLFGLITLVIKHKTVFPQLWKSKRAVILALLAFLVVIAPIALYVMLYPEEYFSRVGQVSIFAQSHNLWDRITVLYQNMKATVVGAFTTGDLNWRHNASGSPFLPLLLAPFFIVGLGSALYQRGKYLFALAIMIAMCAPAIMTNDGLPPHGLRLIGTIPFVFLFAAIPLTWLLNLKGKVSKWVGHVLVVVILTAISWQGYQNYFGQAPYQAHYYYDYRCDLTALTSHLKTTNSYHIVADDFSFDTIKYLMLPQSVVHETPEHFLQNFNQSYVQAHPQIILATAFGKFDQRVIDILSKDYEAKLFPNKFDRGDYYVFISK
jgi:hypothetical protein